MLVLPKTSVEWLPETGKEFNLEEAKAKMATALAPFSVPARRRILKGVEKQLFAEKTDIEKRLPELRKERDEVAAKLAASEAAIFWFSRDDKNLSIEKNDCSRLHKLKAAMKCGMVLDREAEPIGRFTPDELTQTFVVRHDWGQAFDGASDLTDEWRLPYDVCAFEFRIDGVSIISIWGLIEGTHKGVDFLEFSDFWFPVAEEGALTAVIAKQVRSICIALDAEVATSEVIRAPVALNEKRQKAGREPLSDYRVVDLSRRHRVSNPGTGESGRKVRLHFRRGHWRHYEEHKTWIRWMLVGDPDLGFIQKHYAL